MKSWIFMAVLALAVCSCGLLIAQEQGAESPATSASIEQSGAAKEEAAPPAAAPAKGGAEAPSSPSTSAAPAAPAAPAASGN